MNPDTMNYLVNSLDDAMIDRFISIEVTADIHDYVAYSRANQGNEEVLEYLMANPDMLLVTKKSADSSPLTKAPTPRGWTKVQEIMNQCQLPDKLLLELIAGIVGPIGAASFVGYMNTSRLAVPSSKAIVTSYDEEKAKVIVLVAGGQFPILTKVIDQVVIELDNRMETLANVEQFLVDLPEELQLYFYKVVSRDRDELLDEYIEQSVVFEKISDLVVDMMS